MDFQHFLHYWLFTYVHIGTRYLLTAASIFFLFYFVLKNLMQARKVQAGFPSFHDYRRDFLYSAMSIGIFALISFLTMQAPASINHMYQPIDKYGMAYYAFTFVWMFLLHDAYFYWTHRIMHHPKIFKYVHRIHHKSTNPSPWTAYAFHPVEAVLETSIVPLIAFTLPVHFSALNLYMLFQIGYNVYGHLGYEIFPANTNRHWLGKWFNTSVSHNMHHQFFKHNFGLWTTFWDRKMGTFSPKYDDHFDACTNGENASRHATSDVVS